MCNQKCVVCPKLIISTAVAVSGSNMAITIPATTLQNRQKICLLLAQNIPSGAGTLPAVISDGSTAIAMLRPCGNYVRADQLRTRRRYVLTVATTPASAIVRNTQCLECTTYTQPQILPATASARTGADED